MINYFFEALRLSQPRSSAIRQSSIVIPK